MKTRKGFVSNSSSSSFIVASDLDELVEITLRSHLSSLSRYQIRTLEDYKKYFDLEYIWTTWEEYIRDYEEEYNTIMKAIEQGKTVYIGYVGNEYDYGEMAENIYFNGFPEGNYEIIRKP